MMLLDNSNTGAVMSVRRMSDDETVGLRESMVLTLTGTLGKKSSAPL